MTQEFIKAAAYLLEKIERRPAPAGEMINTYLATHKYLKGEEYVKIKSDVILSE